ncbi:MAG: arsenosugar biosynthesis radical SAM (seleno)protein ArsS [Myxococcaceae bacterium]
MRSLTSPNSSGPLPGEGPASFDETLGQHGLGALRRGQATTLQVNLGKVCNNACHHCHVEAGPARVEAMPAQVIERVISLLSASPRVTTLDLTGGAPELNAGFRRLVTAARGLGREVIDRCNLTVLLQPGQEDLAGFLAGRRVRIVASLPCYTEENVDRQRGRGVYAKSIEALRRLNSLGYGRPGTGLELELVYNPGGAALPGSQEGLERDYRRELRARFGLEFNRLLTVANMPIKRFDAQLRRTGQAGSYQRLLVESFNPAAVPALMCRSLVSVGHDGGLYDCDFNQMLELGLGGERAPAGVWDLDSLDSLEGDRIATAPHCFGCTAGAGSSCSGALVAA